MWRTLLCILLWCLTLCWDRLHFRFYISYNCRIPDYQVYDTYDDNCINILHIWNGIKSPKFYYKNVMYNVSISSITIFLFDDDLTWRKTVEAFFIIYDLQHNSVGFRCLLPYLITDRYNRTITVNISILNHTA